MRTYIVIDLKTFFASVECVERDLDPFTNNLVVADPSRGNGAICLAISSAMKAKGIKNRCRIYEIPPNVKYITALPRMNLYIKYSAEVYGIYLKYISKEDIHPYSVDEAFLDVTNYLKMYNLNAKQLAQKIMKTIFDETGITATAGIGTNMYLAKIALDITAKHVEDNIGYLDEIKYKEELWNHQPLSDFWQVGRGISNRLKKYGINDMYGIAHFDEEVLYKEFGINAEFLIDHSKGIETCTIEEIKKYKPKSNSFSTSQILFEDYGYQDTLLVLKEMIDLGSLKLIDNQVVTNTIGLRIGYSKDRYKSTGGTRKIEVRTNIYSRLVKEFINLYENTTRINVPIRQVAISFQNLESEIYEQFDIFSDAETIVNEKKLECTMNDIKKKYGKNAILRGMNLSDKATTIKRNKLVGGHNAEGKKTK
jgi:DNA polymerase V